MVGGSQTNIVLLVKSNIEHSRDISFCRERSQHNNTYANLDTASRRRCRFTSCLEQTVLVGTRMGKIDRASFPRSGKDARV